MEGTLTVGSGGPATVKEMVVVMGVPPLVQLILSDSPGMLAFPLPQVRYQVLLTPSLLMVPNWSLQVPLPLSVT